jgi:hypothetical protein
MSSSSSPLAPGLDGLSAVGYKLPPWIYPPAEFQPIETGPVYINVPAIGATANIIQIQIPTGNNGIITNIGNSFVGGGWTEGTGAVTWQIARDGAPVDGYDLIPGSLGSPSNPTRHPCGFRVFENQIVTLSITNVSVVLAGQLSGGRFMGWYYPMEYEDPNLTTM